MLSEALRDAVRAGRLADNVAAHLTLPRRDPDRDLDPERLHTWDAEKATFSSTVPQRIKQRAASP